MAWITCWEAWKTFILTKLGFHNSQIPPILPYGSIVVGCVSWNWLKKMPIMLKETFVSKIATTSGLCSLNISLKLALNSSLPAPRQFQNKSFIEKQTGRICNFSDLGQAVISLNRIHPWFWMDELLGSYVLSLWTTSHWLVGVPPPPPSLRTIPVRSWLVCMKEIPVFPSGGFGWNMVRDDWAVWFWAGLVFFCIGGGLEWWCLSMNCFG